jgi:CAAX prenyl protease-like protein
MARTHPEAAHLLPLVCFLLIGAAGEWAGIEGIALWIYPLQALVGLGLVAWFWPAYSFGPLRGVGWIIFAAPLACALWVAPSLIYARFGCPLWLDSVVPGINLPARTLLGLAERGRGFDPAAYEGTILPPFVGLVLRFVRLVVTVPLIEEICWRGFVMRLVDDPGRAFHENPFGRHRWRSFLVVTALVVAAHQPVDWIGAFAFGCMTYGIAVGTKSLTSCVLFHALVNLWLGLYVMATRQWGFW